MTFMEAPVSTAGMRQRISGKATAIEIRDGEFAKLNWNTPAPTLQVTAASVSVTAVELAAEDPNRTTITVANTGSATLYLGGPDVASGTGFPVAAGTSLQLATSAAVWAVTASGSTTVRTLLLTV